MFVARVSARVVYRRLAWIAREHAKQAGVVIDVRQGNAAAMPFADASFDFVVCMAAFKNFADPIGALNEIHRVLKPGGQASIFDLRKEAAPEDIETGVRNMRTSAWNAALTRWTFRHMLLKRAYRREDLERMARVSRFGRCEIVADGIGFELRLAKTAGVEAAMAG